MVKFSSGSKLFKRKKYQIATNLHEGAIAISGESQLDKIDFDSALKTIKTKFEDLAEWISISDGVVGHLKSFIMLDSQRAMISSTGDDVTIRLIADKDNQQEKAVVNIALIVFGIDQNVLEEELIKLFDALEACEKEENYAPTNG
ncbi:MAG: hypothetical protein PWP56_2624 [Acetobacterium sp.]|jgi:hypothetical protein|nr:hypothetical protein [Acetobacterium sp.]